MAGCTSSRIQIMSQNRFADHPQQMEIKWRQISPNDGVVRGKRHLWWVNRLIVWDGRSDWDRRLHIRSITLIPGLVFNDKLCCWLTIFELYQRSMPFAALLLWNAGSVVFYWHVFSGVGPSVNLRLTCLYRRRFSILTQHFKRKEDNWLSFCFSLRKCLSFPQKM